MGKSFRGTLSCLGLACVPAFSASAQELPRPDEHAPIAVMGDHVHDAGELMLSYRYMRMTMAGNRDGSRDLSAPDIATSAPNRFFGRPMQPPTLRVVPTDMTMDMHMLGVMYAPIDRVTIMGMLHYVEKSMDHTSFAGGTGTQVLGRFTTEASGLGDAAISALVSLREWSDARLHLTAGVSLPTGDTHAVGRVLAPTGMTPELRLPYPMQLGSGSTDLLLGLTYARLAAGFSWGAQWRSTVRIEDNDDGYRLGDEHRITGWAALPLGANLSLSARLEWFDRGNVDGMDPLIVAPVQTADPARQGASRIDAALGVNFATAVGHRLAVEWVVPVQERLDGPQMSTDDQLVLGYQYSF